MSSLHGLELDWIAAFQGDGHFKQIMIWCSYLGSEAIPYVLPFVYFVISQKGGARLYVLVSLAGLWVYVLKLAFHSPRPFWVDTRIHALGGSGGYGLPSGHTLVACVVWPTVAQMLNARWAWFGAVVVVLAVSVSRVYLGVHFISDVVGAWSFAALLLLLVNWLERSNSKLLKPTTMGTQLGLSLLATATYIATAFIAQLASDLPVQLTLSPNLQKMHGALQAGGGFFAALSGIIMAWHWRNVEATTPLWARCSALVYALVGSWTLTEIGKLTPTSQIQVLRLLSDFLGGAFGTWWVLLLAPWILLKAGLLCQTSRQTPLAIGSA